MFHVEQWEELLKQCEEDTKAHNSALEWYLNSWLNMSEEEQKEYVQKL